ncbi:unnamed protein product, partial [Linum tenue]
IRRYAALHVSKHIFGKIDEIVGHTYLFLREQLERSPVPPPSGILHGTIIDQFIACGNSRDTAHELASQIWLAVLNNLEENEHTFQLLKCLAHEGDVFLPYPYTKSVKVQWRVFEKLFTDFRDCFNHSEYYEALACAKSRFQPIPSAWLGDDLIAPCHCKGTQKYVHRSCLDNWRSTKEGFAFAHCTECRALFVLRANVPPDRWWLRLKFQFLVARDHAFIFIAVQLIVAILGVLVYRFYGEELREMFGYEEHPYGFYTMGVLAIVLVGLLYGFFIAIICGQRINERHYHVLAKQELTKEYVVEDRDASKNVTELDPSHVTELQMLGLF